MRSKERRARVHSKHYSTFLRTFGLMAKRDALQIARQRHDIEGVGGAPSVNGVGRIEKFRQFLQAVVVAVHGNGGAVLVAQVGRQRVDRGGFACCVCVCG